jgi:hypothetical protein
MPHHRSNKMLSVVGIFFLIIFIYLLTSKVKVRIFVVLINQKEKYAHKIVHFIEISHAF